MKLAVLGGVAVLCAATAVGLAQQGGTEQQTQTVIGCVKGEGTAQAPWMLTGVVIPPTPPANAGRGGGGGRGGRGGAGREGGGGAPAAAPAPPPPPPAPIDLRIQGLDLTPWRGYRAQIEGTMGPAGAGGARTFNAISARSVYNYNCSIEPPK